MELGEDARVVQCTVCVLVRFQVQPFPTAFVRERPAMCQKVLVLVSRSSSVMRYNDRELGSVDKVRKFVVDEDQLGARVPENVFHIRLL